MADRSDGDRLLERRRYEAAYEAYDAVIRSGHGTAGEHAGRGITLLVSGRYDEALADLDRALALDPDHWDARYYRNVVYARLGRYQEALADLERLASGPERVEVLSDWGAVLAKLGRRKEALPPLRRAVELDPDSVPAHANLGSVLAMLGRYADAIPHYATAARAGAPGALAALERAYDEAFVAAVDDGSAGAGQLAFLDARDTDDLKRAVRRWPVLANPRQHDAMRDAIDELPLSMPAERTALRQRLELLRTIATPGERV